MSEVLRFGNTLVLGEIESTYGTDPTPAAADAAVAYDVEVRLDGEDVTREQERGYFGARPFIIANRQATLSASIEMASVGSGSLGNAAPFGKFLRAAGMGEVLTASTRSDYNPISTGFESSAIYAWRNQQRYAVLGNRGSARLEFSMDRNPLARYSYTGIFAIPTDVAQISGDFSAYQEPVLVDENSSSVSLDGFALNARSLTIDLGQQANIYAGTEERCAAITDRNMTGEIIAFAPDLTAKNYFQLAANHTKMVLDAAFGTSSGSIVEVDAPNVQIGMPEDTDINGAHGIRIPLTFLPSSGNDELQLGFL